MHRRHVRVATTASANNHDKSSAHRRCRPGRNDDGLRACPLWRARPHRRQGGGSGPTSPRPSSCGAGRSNCWTGAADRRPFVDAGFKAQAVNFIAGDKVIGRVSMESVQSPYPFGLMLPQSETERLLEERLRGLGVDVERQVELATFKSGADGVEAVLRHADGREEAVSADWLVGCDGAHSAVRHGLAAPFAGETMDSDWMLADVHMTGYPYPGQRGLGVLASGWRVRHLPDLAGPLSGDCGLACLPAPSIRRRRRWSRCRRSSIGGGRAG